MGEGVKAVASADFPVRKMSEHFVYKYKETTMRELVTCNRFASSPSNGLEWSAMLAPYLSGYDFCMITVRLEGS